MCGNGESEAVNSYSVRHSYSFRHSKLNPPLAAFPVSVPCTAWSEPIQLAPGILQEFSPQQVSRRVSCRGRDTSLCLVSSGREFLGPASAAAAPGAAAAALARSHKDFILCVKGFSWLCFLELRYFWHQCL